MKIGSILKDEELRKLRALSKSGLQRFLNDGILVEEWLSLEDKPKQRLLGYQVTDGNHWSELSSRKSSPVELFHGVKSRSELKEQGWTDHLIRKALKIGILNAVHSEHGGVLDFIKGRPEVASIILNDEQRQVVDTVERSLDNGFKPFLLHGITGSGKTIVYCHLAQTTLNKAKTVLVLTPEIALSGTTLAYFRGFFGDLVTVIHSGMTERERLESWQGIQNGKYRIVIGPRSAVFAPLSNLGLIIVDEEHDGSYKQDDPSPRFQGRDCAIMRAKLNNIPVLLGSASPSIESYFQTQNGRYELLKLTKRPGSAVLPEVRIVDMKDQGVRGDLPFVSLTLKKEIEKRIKSGDQIILFLNRRGYAPMLKCSDCGHTPSCPACQLHLTYHKIGQKLVCHYCGYVISKYDTCEQCHGHSLFFLGAGTQKVEEVIPRLFSEISTVRLDSDTASGRQNAHRILNDFALRKYQLLLGTQMVTKGLDLPDVSLVGVLSADLGIDIPDFRAAERTFSRLLQVAGRAGRSERRGEVLIQTYSPESAYIIDAANQDYLSFFTRECKSRQDSYYPPFVRLVNIILSDSDEDKLIETSFQFISRIKEELFSENILAEVLGPAPCPLYRLRKLYRRHVLIKTKQTTKLIRMFTEWENREPRFKLRGSTRIVIDVDPDDMM